MCKIARYATVWVRPKWSQKSLKKVVINHRFRCAKLISLKFPSDVSSVATDNANSFAVADKCPSLSDNFNQIARILRFISELSAAQHILINFFVDLMGQSSSKIGWKLYNLYFFSGIFSHPFKECEWALLIVFILKLTHQAQIAKISVKNIDLNFQSILIV